MKPENLVMGMFGMALMANGFFLFTRRGYAEWGLNLGRARIWVRLLGLERALKVAKYVFAPLCFLLGLFSLAVSAVASFHPG